MKTESIDFMGSSLALPGYLWTPEDITKGMILVIHGMTEHAGRYAGFAQYMTKHGFAVAAYDLRGHGRHPGDPDVAAMEPGDWEKNIDDIDLVLGQLRSRFDGIPLYLMGFSLGSFLVREYLQRQQVNADGVILMGTGWQPGWMLKLMRTIVRTQIHKAGFTRTTPLVRTLSFGAYNQKFKPNRTHSDWLCSDEAALDGYLADPLCRADIASGTFYELLGAMERTGVHQESATKKLPNLLLCGEKDPVGDFGKGVTAVHRLLMKAGYPVVLKTYPGARHMLLNEEAGGQADQARTDLLEWLHTH